MSSLYFQHRKTHNTSLSRLPSSVKLSRTVRPVLPSASRSMSTHVSRWLLSRRLISRGLCSAMNLQPDRRKGVPTCCGGNSLPDLLSGSEHVHGLTQRKIHVCLRMALTACTDRLSCRNLQLQASRRAVLTNLLAARSVWGRWAAQSSKCTILGWRGAVTALPAAAPHSDLLWAVVWSCHIRGHHAPWRFLGLRS